MTLKLRPIREDDLARASALCLRSKAYWGYGEAFMAACVDELTLTREDIVHDPVIIAEDAQGLAGVAHVSIDETGCYLEKLFIDTDRIGQGYGQTLYDWALSTARDFGARELIVEADPDAAPFYEKMGCVRAGEVPSGSVAGRVLPRYIHKL